MPDSLYRPKAIPGSNNNGSAVALLFLGSLSLGVVGQTPGALDTAFAPDLGASLYIRAAAVQPDGRILVGGDIPSFNGQPRSHIIRLNQQWELDAADSFNLPNRLDGRVGRIAVQPDGRIILIGSFTHVNGEARKTIARIHSDGSTEALPPSI